MKLLWNFFLNPNFGVFNIDKRGWHIGNYWEWILDNSNMEEL